MEKINYDSKQVIGEDIAYQSVKEDGLLKVPLSDQYVRKLGGEYVTKEQALAEIKEDYQAVMFYLDDHDLQMAAFKANPYVFSDNIDYCISTKPLPSVVKAIIEMDEDNYVYFRTYEGTTARVLKDMGFVYDNEFKELLPPHSDYIQNQIESEIRELLLKTNWKKNVPEENTPIDKYFSHDKAIAACLRYNVYDCETLLNINNKHLLNELGYSLIYIDEFKETLRRFLNSLPKPEKTEFAPNSKNIKLTSEPKNDIAVPSRPNDLTPEPSRPSLDSMIGKAKDIKSNNDREMAHQRTYSNPFEIG